MSCKIGGFRVASALMLLVCMLCWDVKLLAEESSSYIYMSRKRTPQYYFNEGEGKAEDGDYARALELYLLAAYDGQVVAADYNSSMGNYIMIDHGDGLYTVYMHCSSLSVSAGASVPLP